MSAFKAPRDLQVIQNEYTGLCTRAGHLGYQIETLNKDLAIIHETLRDLNAEANAAQKAKLEAEEAAKKQEAPKAVEEPQKESKPKAAKQKLAAVSQEQA